MKRSYTILILWFCALLVQGQARTNDWIDYSKSYYKIKIAKNQLYRLPYTTLANIDLPLKGHGFQLYYKGKQVPLYVTTTNTFQEGDYIEFYGEKNDGSFDTQLFQEEEWQLQASNSLFTDTASYFLTWEDITDNRRIKTVNNVEDNSLAKETHFQYTIDKPVNNIHYGGTPFRVSGLNNNYADFEEAEGFLSTMITKGTDRVYTIKTPYVFSQATTPVKLTTKVVGMTNDFLHIPDHHMRISVNDNVYVDDTYEGYQNKTYNFDVPVSMLTSDNTRLKFKSVGDISSKDNNSVAYFTITYPRKFNFEQLNNFAFTVANDDAKYIEIKDFKGGDSPVLYDLTNHVRLIPTKTGNSWKVYLPKPVDLLSPNRKLVIANTNEAVKPITEVIKRQFTDFSKAVAQGNYLIISHPSLTTGENWPKQYETYRNSNIGGNYQAQLVMIDELYDQFAYGIEKHPQAIRNFINTGLETWTVKPEYLLLLGKSLSYNYFRYSPTQYQACLVPTFGANASDNMLVTKDNSTYQPQLAVGRVSAKNSGQVKAYLEKIKQYEANLQSPTCDAGEDFWLKNALTLIQGNQEHEVDQFTGYVEEYEKMIKNSALGVNVIDRHVSLGTVPVPKLKDQINDGVSLILHIGHGIGSSIVFDFHHPSYYDNEGKYPFFLSTSCFVGNIHSINSTMAIDHVVANKRGMIGFMSYVSFGFPAFANVYNKELIRQFSDENYDQPLGVCIQKTIEKLYKPSQDDLVGKVVKVTCQDFTLSGDPAIRLYAKPKPDYSIKLEEMKFFDPTTNENLPVEEEVSMIPAGSTEVGLSFIVHNFGKAIQDSLKIKVTGLLSDGSTQKLIVKKIAPPTYQDTIRWIIPNDTILGGKTYVLINIDPNQDIAEVCESNNIIAKTMEYEKACTENSLDDLIAIDEHQEVCSANLPLSLTVQTETTGLTYSWSTGATSNSIEVTAAGTYIVVIKNEEGCILTKEIIVDVSTAPVVNLGEDKVVCREELPMVLSTLTEANGSIAYQWSTGVQTPTLTVVTGGTYSVTVTNAQGCQAIETVTIEEVAAMATTIAPIQKVCEENLPLQLDAGTWGAGTTYQWSTGAKTKTIEVNEAGTYDVTIINEQGCLIQESIEVIILPTPIVSLGEDIIVCEENLPALLTPIVEGAEQVTYTWSTGATSEQVKAYTAGTYEVVVSTPDGCTSKAQVNVTVVSAPILNITGTAKICESDLPYDLTVQNEQEGVNYSWSTGDTGSQTTITEGGVYELKAITHDGCVAQLTVKITVVTEPNIELGTTISVITKDLPFELHPGEFKKYNWSNGTQGAIATIYQSGVYGVTVTDENNCKAKDEVNITVKDEETKPTLAESITIFPNPVAHNLIISGNVFGTIQMSLFNLNGQLIIKVPLSGFESRYNMDHLLTGTYLLRLEYEGDVFSQTIVKH